MSEEDVLDEFENFRSQVGIDQYRCKFVKRKYAFEDKDVEKGESDWLEVVYGFDRESSVPVYRLMLNKIEPAIPMDSSGATFSHIFGTNTTPFELFVVNQKIMGPSWLEIKDIAPVEKAVCIIFCYVEQVLTLCSHRGASLSST